MDALQKAIAGDTGLSPAKGRTRKKMNNNHINDPSKLTAPVPGGNLSSYDTDDQTDQMMDMLVKNATSTEKRTRIRKNRKKDSTSTRKSGKFTFIKFVTKTCIDTERYWTTKIISTAEFYTLMAALSLQGFER